MLQYFPSIATTLNTLIINACCVLSSAFSVSTNMIVWSNLSLYWCISWWLFVLMWILNHTFIYRMNSTWSWFMFLLMYCLMYMFNNILLIFISFLHLSWSVILACNFCWGSMGATDWTEGIGMQSIDSCFTCYTSFLMTYLTSFCVCLS